MCVSWFLSRKLFYLGLIAIPLVQPMSANAEIIDEKTSCIEGYPELCVTQQLNRTTAKEVIIHGSGVNVEPKTNASERWSGSSITIYAFIRVLVCDGNYSNID